VIEPGDRVAPVGRKLLEEIAHERGEAALHLGRAAAVLGDLGQGQRDQVLPAGNSVDQPDRVAIVDNSNDVELLPPEAPIWGPP